MADPLRDIEDRQAHKDMGRIWYCIYLGARDEGASLFEAFLVIAAMFCGMLRNGKLDEEGGDEL